MSSISSRSSQGSRTPRSPKWRSSQFLSTSAQPATSISKVVAQPLQGSPLRSAIEGLPPNTLSGEQRSLFSMREMKEQGNVEDCSVEGPQQTGGSDESPQPNSNGQVEDNVSHNSPRADPVDQQLSTSAKDPVSPNTAESPSSSATPAIATSTSVSPSSEAPSPSTTQLTSSDLATLVISTPPASRRSWFSSFSRSRARDVIAKQHRPSKEDVEFDTNMKAAVPLASGSGTELQAKPQAQAQDNAASEPPHDTTGQNTTITSISPPALAASSSIDDVVPPLPSTPQIAQTETASAKDTLYLTSESAKQGKEKQELPERERSPSVSTLNPSTSRFMLRLPLLGRPKIPLEQVITQSVKGHDNTDDHSTTHEDHKDSTNLDVVVDPQTASPNLPEVRVVESSPPRSSETLAESVLSMTGEDIGSTVNESVAFLSSPQFDDPSRTTTVQSQTEAKLDGSALVASSSSWWGYLGWSGSTSASSSTLVAQQEGKSVDRKDDIPADVQVEIANGEGDSPAQPDVAALIATPEQTSIAIASEPPSTPPAVICSVEQTAENKSKVENNGQDLEATPSILSAETAKSHGSTWYSPWSWYAASPIVPQGPISAVSTEGAQDRPSDNVGEHEHAKTESEMVKEAALARNDDGSTPSIESATAPPEVAQPSLEVKLPTPISNPIESTITTNRVGWASFFMSKAMYMKAVRDSDANKLRDRPENEGGMEVMNIDDEGDEGHHDATGVEQNPSPSASKAIIVGANGRAGTPTPSTPSSPTPRSSISPPKEREPKKPGTPITPLTNFDSVKREATKRPVSPASSTSTAPGKKSGSGTSTPQPRVAPPNLVLPTWTDTFLSPPRSNIPPQPTPPSSQRGRLGKTLEYMSGMLFPDAKSKGKGKEREHERSWDRERRWETDLLTFGHELPKAMEVLGHAFDKEKFNVNCRVVVIGVAGWSPGAVTRTLAGGLPSSSSKFVNMMCEALEKFEEEHAFKFKKITRIPLEGDGTIERKLSKVHSHLLGNEEWMQDLHAAEVIFVAAHSQGSIVATHLLDKLIHDGHILTPRNLDIIASAAAAVAPGGSEPASLPRTQKICFLSLCGIHLGPLRYLKTSSLLQPYIQYFENAAARELFDFQNTETQVSKNYVQALRTVMDHGAKMVYIASLNDQVVPIYSGLFTAASHPRILRALYIDGDAYHSSDFLSNLLVLLIRIMNSGLSDSGLIAHLSEATAGTLSGVGHSTAYEELATYSLAVDYLFLATDGPDIRTDLSVESFNAVNEQNDYEIPWSLRDLIADEHVAHFFAQEFSQLRDAFDDWSPKTSILRDVKRKLQPIQRLSSIKRTTYSSRL